jgi:CRISPR-associated protein Cas1
MNLVINSYGATLQKENNLFVITTSEGKQTFPPDVVKTITISKSARITSDAIILAIKNQVDVLFVNDMGQPEGRVWSVKYGSVSNIRKAQINFLYSAAAVKWVKELIITKIDRQAALLLGFQPLADENLKLHNIFKYAINSMEDYKRKIDASEGEFVSDIAASLRGWEGAASRKYFVCLSALLPEKYQFESRDRMPAKDPFNALLNYAYGILYGKVEGALIKAGIDPYAGIFHRDEYNRPALVFDVIESYRCWMDYVVFRLCEKEAIPDEAFEVIADTGAIRLSPLAKRILIQSVNDFLSEIIAIGKPLSRLSHIESDAYQLANHFLKNENNALDR